MYRGSNAKLVKVRRKKGQKEGGREVEKNVYL